ncbi:MAG: translation elongation factor Ts [Acholeplasmataceae bacterium]|nr:translation elongation factor Ts [Acholeplasmataceae bacterium]
MTLDLIKKLREETQSGILECKKALQDANGNYEEALKILKNTFVAHDGNKRVASKGLCNVFVDQNQAILYEINAETDFVSKNENFIHLVQSLASPLLASNATNPVDAKKILIGEKTVDEMISQTSSIIKENAYLRRFYRVVKEDSYGFGTYIHNQGKVVTLVILNKDLPILARDLAMQVAANSPSYLDTKYIDLDTMNYERFMYEKNHGEVNDELFHRHLEDISLTTQAWVKNPDLKVYEILNEQGVEIIDFFRFELGQGIDSKLSCRLDIPCDGSKITVTPIY